jgi:hypothetical protein
MGFRIEGGICYLLIVGKPGNWRVLEKCSTLEEAQSAARDWVKKAHEHQNNVSSHNLDELFSFSNSGTKEIILDLLANKKMDRADV